MSVTLPTEMARAVFDRIRTGQYGSAGELIREAVRRLLEAEPAVRQSDDDDAGEAPPPPRRGGRRAP